MKTSRWLLLLTLLLPVPLAAQTAASADSAWKRGDMVAAERMYGWLLKQDSSDAVALYRYALTQAWKKRYAESLHLFDRLLAIDPEDAYVRVGRARVLAWSGERRAATASLDSVLARDPRATEARELRLTIARWSMRTTATPAFVYESDSEGNDIANARMGLMYSISEPFEVRADAYYRRAELNGAGKQAAYGAAAGVWHRGTAGWTMFLQAGASTSNATDATTYPVLRAYVLTPRSSGRQASLTYAYSPLDLTSLLMQQRVTTSELSAAFDFGADSAISGHLSLSTAGYHGRTSDRDNRRVAGSATVLRRVSPTLSAGVAAHAFRFSEDLTDGYFDPDFYGNMELIGRLEQVGHRLTFSAELAPGVQRVRTAMTSTSGTWRGTARLGRMFAAGRTIEAYAVYARSGANQLSPQTSTRYNYRAFGISANWIF